MKRGEVFVQIRPLKEGSSVSSSPAQGYHEDVTELRVRIMNEIQRNPKNKIEFCTWHQVLKSYWSAIQEQKFAVRFEGIKNVQEHLRSFTVLNLYIKKGQFSRYFHDLDI